jgi:hypothetical protein
MKVFIQGSKFIFEGENKYQNLLGNNIGARVARANHALLNWLSWKWCVRVFPRALIKMNL